MRGFPSILSLFRNVINKFNKTGARKLHSILSYDIRTTLKSHFWHKKVISFALCMQRKMDVITFPEHL